jgi:hypothetical protein
VSYINIPAATLETDRSLIHTRQLFDPIDSKSLKGNDQHDLLTCKIMHTFVDKYHLHLLSLALAPLGCISCTSLAYPLCTSRVYQVHLFGLLIMHLFGVSAAPLLTYQLHLFGLPIMHLFGVPAAPLWLTSCTSWVYQAPLWLTHYALEHT